MHLFWRLPAGVPDAAVLEVLARRVRVGVHTLASGGAWEAVPSLLAQRGIILGYASLTPKQIEQGVARLSDAIDEAVERRQIDIDELAARPAPLHYAPPPGAARLASKFHQRPALRAAARPRAGSAAVSAATQRAHMSEVKAIYRYPIKGLSAHPMPRVEIEAGRAFPFDRVFALVRPGAPIDPDAPKWAKKGLFLMSMLDDGLSEIEARLDPDTLRLTIARGDEPMLIADLGERDGRAAVETFFRKQIPGLRETPAAAVRSRDGHFADKPENLISLINPRDGSQPRGAMGLRDRSAPLSRQPLCRRFRGVAGIRLDRRGPPPRRDRVPRRSTQRPLRRDQRQPCHGPSRSRHSRVLARRVRP